MRYIYTGKVDPPQRKWKIIQDTPNERQNALNDGYNAFSMLAFSEEPEEGKPKPMRFGDLFIDIDNKDPAKAVMVAREFVSFLQLQFGVDPEMLRFWLSGKKGCHLLVPAVLFGGEEGDQILPLIHKHFLDDLFELYRNTSDATLTLLNISKSDFDFDASLYNMEKGKLLRAENVLRDNGLYKVPVTWDELSKMSYEALEALTHAPRFVPDSNPPVRVERLAEIYESTKNTEHLVLENKLLPSTLKEVQSCKFIKHCRDNAAILSEPEWFAMVSVLAPLGSEGAKLIHAFSKPHEEYTYEATQKKIANARKKNTPISCAKIKENFNCGCDCGVTSPVRLYLKKDLEGQLIGQRFIQDLNGVYFLKNPFEPAERELVCSPLKVLAQTRDSESGSWGKLVEFDDPDGHIHRRIVFNTALKGMGDQLCEGLCSEGLRVAPAPKARERLMNYLFSQNPEKRVRLVKRQGWHGEVYILGEKAFGPTNDEEYLPEFDTTGSVFATSGNLEDWQVHVGHLCLGHPLLELGVSAAFVGPLLSPCAHDGFGIHFNGPSSCGKTTALRVAGSVSGGGPHGFIKQWRTTDNALESVASQHNDNLLCLDEIGQASPQTVAQTAYMLANGQGKGRANRDGSARTRAVWKLVFLSNGECTLDDKILEDRFQKVHAGQTVRVIDLEVNDRNGVFSILPEGEGGREWSLRLTQNTMNYYGTAFHCFLEQLSAGLPDAVARVTTMRDEFVAEHCPPQSSPQVYRVCAHFGMIAAAGELAIGMNILPWPVGTALRAAQACFNSWLIVRGGHGNMELEGALNRLQQFILAHKDTRFIDLSVPGMGTPYSHAGYKWISGLKEFYLILPDAFDKEVRCGVHRGSLMRELEQRGWLAKNANGNIMETKCISGTNIRGIVIVADAWKDKSIDCTSRPEVQKDNNRLTIDECEDFF